MLTLLENKTYRRLFAAQVLSLIGTGLTTVALALLAYRLAGANAGAVLGTALALKMIAYVVIAPIAGAYASSVPRRSLLVTLDLVRAGFIAFLPFVTEIWQIYVLVFAFQACSAAFTPTFQATIPDILPDEKDYTRALSLSRLAYDTEALVSPSLAALLLGIMSYSNLFVGTVIGFLASAALVLSTTLPAAKSASATGGLLQRVSWGMRIYLSTPRLRGLLAVNVAAAAVGAFVIVNSIVLVRSVLGGSDVDLAKLMAAYGIGSIVVALTLPRMLDRYPDERPWMLAASALLAVGLIVSLVPTTFTQLMMVWVGLGAANALALTPGGRLLRRSSTDADRPALFAAQFSLSHACWLVTYPLAGWVGATWGLTAAAITLALLAGAAVVVALVIWPRQDWESIEHTHDGRVIGHTQGPATHSHPFVIDAHHRIWPTK
ncbi:MAG: MFS transporter [Hyphomicrobiaceae bacterium]|nr:MFS transporter [Hyphomicrobiaceae bacterium]